jgi:DNA-binding SARP family transcriptional activator
LDVRILGPLRVLRDGVELDLGRPKQRLLLAVLIAAGGETVSVDRLADEVWGDHPPPRAAASVQAYISRLRHVLEPDRPARTPARVLVTRTPGYALHLDADELDVTRFAREAAEVQHLLRAGRFERAHVLAGEALARWSGEVLADLGDEAVARRERPRWHDLRLTVTEDRLHAAVELGLHATAIADLEQLLDAEPMRERALGLLLRSLYLAGRPVEALERYRAYRTELQDELGLDPGTDLQALEAAILRQDPSLSPSVPEPSAPAAGAAAAAADAVGDADAGPEPVSGLVGRADELVTGATFLDDIRAGRTRWLTLAGEAGIGKSRLAEELARRAADRDIEVAWGRCHEDDDAPAYWPWSQLLRALTPGDPDPVATLLADELPPDPGARRYRLHERIGELLLAGGPRLLVVDDVQWADAASLQLLEYLAVQVRVGAIGLVLTVRTGVDRPELRRATAAVARHDGAVRRDLEPLDPSELAELAVHVTGTALDAESADRLHTRTAGNPFFATELLRLPQHRGARGDAPLPAAVREVIEHRLVPLGEDVRAALDVAAVVGVSFELSVVEDASGMEVDRVFDALDLAVATGLVVAGEDGTGEFRFTHALVRDALLADLSPMRRQRTHARVAEALEHRPRLDPALHAAELAHHLVSAAVVVGAVPAREAAERAAQAAEARLASSEAAGWWDTARDLVGAEGSAVEVDRLGIAAGRAHLLAGQIERGRGVLCDVMDAAARREDAAAGAAAGTALASSGGAWHWVGPNESPDHIVTRLERADAALGDGDHPLRVGLLATLALGVYYVDPERAARLVHEALDMARRLGDPHLLALALLGVLAGDWGPGSTDRHLAVSAELLALPSEVRPPQLDVAARLWRLTALCEQGDLAGLDAELARAASIAGSSGLVILQTQVAVARIGRAWLGAGGLPAVEEAVEAAAALHRRSGLYAEEAVRLGSISVIRWMEGRLEEVADELPMLFDTGAYRPEFEAMALLAAGTPAAALDALATAPPAPPTWQWLGTRVLRSMLLLDCAATGCDVRALAADVRADLAPYVDRIAVMGTTMTAFGPVRLHLGALDLVLGDLAGAEANLRAALLVCERLDAAIWATVARLHLGTLRRLTGHEADGRGLLARARTDAHRLGLTVSATRAAAALVDPPSGQPTSRTDEAPAG